MNSTAGQSDQVNPNLGGAAQKSAGLQIGAVLPEDMTVKLVRAESADAEIFLSVLYTFVVGLFGIFLGGWIADSQQTQPVMAVWTKVACVMFGLISLVLVAAWFYIKIKQRRKTVKIPYQLLSNYEERQ